jgi:hypothetical protein
MLLELRQLRKRVPQTVIRLVLGHILDGSAVYFRGV